MAERKEGIGLAISGGGFRATLFHLGSIWRLNELGYLNRLSRICSVSGGSILAAYLGYKWGKLEFNGSDVAVNIEKEIINPICRFCMQSADVRAIVSGWLTPFSSPSAKLAKKYDKGLFNGAKLKDLPSPGEGPEILIYSTNMNTGASVQLKKNNIWDYKIGEYSDPDFSLATAVTASSAFPPFFTPLVLKTRKEKWKKGSLSICFENETLKERMILSDGGVYDNLGTEAIWDEFTTVLVSDAGAPLDITDGSFGLTYRPVKKMLRVLMITMEQVRSLRVRTLIDMFKRGDCKGTYWGIATDIDRYKLDEPFATSNELTRSLKEVRTRLNSFSEEEQGHLINWGYALTDAAMRKWVLKGGSKPTKWPVPDYAL
jgi:NTE family protein